jgi:hypothetical protein
MLLHNNTIANAESPSSTINVYSHPSSTIFPPPWIQQYNTNQRLLTEQFFVSILFSFLVLFFKYSFLQELEIFINR